MGFPTFCASISAMLFFSDIIDAERVGACPVQQRELLSSTGLQDTSIYTASDFVLNGETIAPGRQAGQVILADPDNAGSTITYTDYNFVSYLTDDDGEIQYKLDGAYSVFSGVIGLGDYEQIDCDDLKYVNDEAGGVGVIESNIGDSTVVFEISTGSGYNKIAEYAFDVFADSFKFELDISGAQWLKIGVYDAQASSCIAISIGDPVLTCGDCERDGRVLAIFEGLGHSCECQTAADCSPDDPFCHSFEYVAGGSSGQFWPNELYCGEDQVCCCNCEDCANIPF